MVFVEIEKRGIGIISSKPKEKWLVPLEDTKMEVRTFMSLFAEFLGAFLLMASIMASNGNAIVIGATLAIIVFLVGGISGAAVNPAVAAGLWYSGILSGEMFFLYSFFQILGALAAAFTYRIVAA